MLPSSSSAIQTSQPQQSQSLASHFHIYPLIERLATEIETGNSVSMVSELKSCFENCEQILNSISGSKAMTVDGERRKLEESEKLLEQRRFLYNMDFVSQLKSKKQEEEERH
ncbi:hypothetical protein AALP_AA3G153900 [Arabis alpina]|uniref:Mediator of RNA polymerase II transcription subunit 9 n=1 Tax=Arabis alpina TaxID=50452 RepID=A0A087H9D6_ARAAL|nr:hypothetical protein AALP_AA3G153900 [Arabis alpina]